MIVEDQIILELIPVESTSKAHKKQVVSYLKLSAMKLRYLIPNEPGLYCHGGHHQMYFTGQLKASFVPNFVSLDFEIVRGTMDGLAIFIHGRHDD